MFFVFDGLDGSGKTTQLKRFAARLESQGKSVVVAKDPGTTKLGEELRAILLTQSDTPISMRAEMMLFTTARTQLVEEVIRPALADGKFVVLDRYVLSTVVYQGHAGELEAEQVRTINDLATKGLWPQMTFVLDLPVDEATRRLGDDLDRMESRGAAYFEKVRSGFLAQAEKCDSAVVIDASQSEDDVARAILDAARSLPELKEVFDGVE